MDPSELSDLLECSVCLENLDENHKVLPCQHTFCIPCLQDVASKACDRSNSYGEPIPPSGFLCPECRAVVEIPLEQLPSNVILNRLLERLAGSKGQKKKGDVLTGETVNRSLFLPLSVGDHRQLDKVLSSKESSPPQDPNQPCVSDVPGNPATNPFVAMLNASPSAVNPTRPNADSRSSTSSSSSSGTRVPLPLASPPESPLPVLPPKPRFANPAVKSKMPKLTTDIPLPRRPAPPLPGKQLTEASKSDKPHQIHRALYDYHPKRHDELALHENELYFVIEKCQDGWYKGSSLSTLKTGVFPGNYVLQVKTEADVGRAATRFGSKGEDRGDLTSLSRGTTSRPNSGTAGDGDQKKSSPGELPTSAKTQEEVKVIEAFPASTPYELDLSKGDIVVISKMREDGWCKGTVVRTGKAGLFPSSFVQKL